MTAKTKERKVQPGVIGHPTTQYVTTKEVMELLGVKDSKAGDIIKSLRKERITMKHCRSRMNFPKNLR